MARTAPVATGTKARTAGGGRDSKMAGLLHGEETVEPFKENWQVRQEMPEWGVTEKEARRRERGRGE